MLSAERKNQTAAVHIPYSCPNDTRSTILSSTRTFDVPFSALASPFETIARMAMSQLSLLCVANMTPTCTNEYVTHGIKTRQSTFHHPR